MSQISASAPLPPCPALPAARAPQLSRGTLFDAPQEGPAGPWEPPPRTHNPGGRPGPRCALSEAPRRPRPRPSMEVPGPPVSSKPGETSVKWQLCYDVTAKMWWMVSGAAGGRRAGVARGRGRAPASRTWGPLGTRAGGGAGGAVAVPSFPGRLQNGERWSQGGNRGQTTESTAHPSLPPGIGFEAARKAPVSWPRRAPRAASSWQVCRDLARPETLQWPGCDSCHPRGPVAGSSECREGWGPGGRGTPLR